ncbi:GntR family transcriptional regulator [Amycolatopsis sp. WGS_07]|uniref:GntR family transcriptional regulator n=1 Tax=Amycolatopsis sp. WGS_07 TaxID=3076764 RepID=UPI003873A5BA
MGRIQRETVAEKSVAILRERILSGELSPGTPVTEDAVAEDLGASRATIRQALNTLLMDGLLTRHPATRVLQVTTLSPEDVRDIYRARRFLELGGVEAAAHASAEQLARITDAVRDLEKTVHDHDVTGFVQADIRCHVEVVELLGSRHLTSAHRHLMEKLRLVITATEQQEAQVRENLKERLAVHKEFAEQLVSGAVAQARANLAARLDDAEEVVAAEAAAVTARPAGHRAG